MNSPLIRDLFEDLNNTCNYIVLRNWDNLYDDSIYGPYHEDIDILCDDLERFIINTGARRIHKEKDRDNFIVKIGDLDIRFDVRWIGDGYYPTEWERKMLENRILNENNVFIMSPEDYFYSLSYHALVQKPFLSPEYIQKLNESYASMNNSFETPLDEEKIKTLLNNYLKEKGYSVVLARDPGVFFNEKVASNMSVHIDKVRYCRRKLFILKSRAQFVFRKRFLSKT